MRVRIVKAPAQKEVDGVPMEPMIRGMVRDVSPLIGAWLIAEGYAEPEMRASHNETRMFSSFEPPRASADSSNPRRRRDD